MKKKKKKGHCRDGNPNNPLHVGISTSRHWRRVGVEVSAHDVPNGDAAMSLSMLPLFQCLCGAIDGTLLEKT